MHTPTKNEIDEILSQCMEAFDTGSRWTRRNVRTGRRGGTPLGCLAKVTTRSD